MSSSTLPEPADDGGFVDDSDRYQRAHKAVTALQTYLTDIIERTSGAEDISWRG